MNTMKRRLSSIMGLALVAAALCWTGAPAHAQQCGVNWASVSNVPTGNYLRAVTYQGGQFAAAGDKGTILTSPDGLAWSLRPTSASDTLFGIAYGNGRYVAAGDNTLFWSDGGANWTKILITSVNGLRDVAFGANRFVAVGVIGGIITSPDGINWSAVTAPTQDDIYSITFGANQFVAVGQYGLVLTSPDGLVWTPRPSGVGLPLYAVCYDGSLFVAVGRQGTILTSPDGQVWTLRTSPTTLDLLGVDSGAFRFLAVGDTGLILTSPDGITWTVQPSGSGADLGAAAFGNKRLLAAGGNGTILWSDCSGALGHSISGGVTTPSGTPVASVNVGLGGDLVSSTSTGADGRFLFTDIPDGAYSLTPTKSGLTFNPTSRAVVVAGADVSGQDFVQVVVTPPAISSVAKAGNPFRLKIYGTNFHSGCEVKINGNDVPETKFKNAAYLLAKGGAALKSMVPKGATMQVTVTNVDDGGISSPFSFSR
ncbi:MAG: carboxypeptidase regulatory-like domain-containing protein [Acidobacteriota bacterium]